MLNRLDVITINGMMYQSSIDVVGCYLDCKTVGYFFLKISKEIGKA